MSKYLSQYSAISSLTSGDLMLVSRSNVYKKIDYDDLVSSVEASIGTGVSTIAELTDVDLTYLSNSDILQYNSTTLKWEAVSLPSIPTFTGGTAGYIPTFSSTTNIENSVIYQQSTSLLGFFGVTSSSYSFGLGGNSARSIGLERHTTAATAGNNLTIKAGGAYSTGTNLSGGVLILSSGIATGTGSAGVQIYTTTAGSTGTTDRNPTLKATFTGAGALDFEQGGFISVGGNKWLHYTNSDTPTFTTNGSTFLGYNSGLSNNGNGNTGIGQQAGRDLNTGTNNTMVGRFAGQETTNGVNNAFFGYYAGSGVTTTSYNAFFGGYAGTQTSGSYNTACGYHAMPNNTSGGYNTAVGNDSLYSISSGTYNVGVGFQTFNGTAITGSYNTAVGTNAGVYTRTSSASNTYVGANSGVITGTGPFSYGIVLGANGMLTASNTACFGGNSDTSKVSTFYFGNAGLYNSTLGATTQSTISIMPGGTYYSTANNMGGHNLAICGGLSTGTGVNGAGGTNFGDIYFKTTNVSGVSSTTPNSLVTRMTIIGGTGYVGMQSIATPTAFLHLAASTTAAASLCIPSGTAPSSPVNGDIWFDGTDLKLRSGGATYTLTKV
jgi:hypothetical protein